MAFLTPAKTTRRLSLIILAMASLCVMSTNAQPAATEYQVKAAYVLNFARFVE